MPVDVLRRSQATARKIDRSTAPERYRTARPTSGRPGRENVPRRRGYDVRSPPRTFGPRFLATREAPAVPLEKAQVDEKVTDPDKLYFNVIENLGSPAQVSIIVPHVPPTCPLRAATQAPVRTHGHGPHARPNIPGRFPS